MTNLHRETEAARALLANIRDVIGDDEDMAHDAVEGETSLLEEMAKAVARIQEVAAFEAALAAQIEQLEARKSRFANQGERIRTALCVAMGDVGLKKAELAGATLTLKPVPPKVVVTDEAAIPAAFWKPSDPKLDRKALLAALKDHPVDGASLSNGSTTISISVR